MHYVVVLRGVLGSFDEADGVLDGCDVVGWEVEELGCELVDYRVEFNDGGFDPVAYEGCGCAADSEAAVGVSQLYAAQAGMGGILHD